MARPKRQHANSNNKQKPARCIAFANHKGGSGKTTSCLSVAGYLAKGGAKVLVVDFDAQANATSGLGIDKYKVSHTMYDAVLHSCTGQGMPITKVIVATDVANLHLAPSEFDLRVAEQIMFRSRQRTGVLARILEPVRQNYDFILIDLPPSSSLLTINGLCAADQVVVPVDPSIFALETVDDLKKTFRDIQEMTGHALEEIGAVLIRSDVQKTGSTCEVEASLRDMFARVFVVPAADEIFQTQKKGLPISHYAPRSSVGKAYEKIARLIRSKHQTVK